MHEQEDTVEFFLGLEITIVMPPQKLDKTLLNYLQIFTLEK